MSKKIDLDKPLSAEDMQYLLARDQHEQVAFNAVVHGIELPKEVAASMEARGIMSASVERAAAAAGKLSASATEDDDGSTAGSVPVTPEDGPAKYSEEWFDKATIAELKTELSAPERNLSVTGKRSELADRLYDHMVAHETDKLDPEDSSEEQSET